MSTTIFLRDDDVGERTPALEQFVRVFRDRGLPVSYQVIPAKLTQDCADWLREEKAAAPSLFEFGQHGHTHEMIVDGRVEYYEFGPERSVSEQEAVVAEGRAIMAARLGDAIEPRLFTPPRHRFNRDTLTALARQGFSILSASSYPGWKYALAYSVGRGLGLTNIGRSGVSHHGRVRPEAPLVELSIAVAVDDGAPVERDVDALMAAVERARGVTPYVGLMTHHAAWAGPEKSAFLERLADRLAAAPDVRFSTLGPIADKLAA